MRVRVAHASLQHSDSDRQTTNTIEKIFARCEAKRTAFIGGTESEPGKGNTADELLRISDKFGYRAYVPGSQNNGSGSATDCWLAVREDLIESDWRTGFLPAIPGSKELYREAGVDAEFPRWGPKGLVAASFTSLPQLGRINLGVAHYLTGARDPDKSTVHGINHWELNEKLAGVVGDWAREVGKGSGLAFYTGDQNMADSKNNQPQGDTFFGEAMTSLADELKRWQNTGHGPIDVIASYNRDGRVTGQRFRVLDDREFPLATDHFFLEGVFSVEPLKS